MSPTFRRDEIFGVRIPTVFEENDATQCAGCGEPIGGVPFRVTLLDIVPGEASPSWAIGAAINPGPHQFHAVAAHFRLWAGRAATSSAACPTSARSCGRSPCPARRRAGGSATATTVRHTSSCRPDAPRRRRPAAAQKDPNHPGQSLFPD